MFVVVACAPTEDEERRERLWNDLDRVLDKVVNRYVKRSG